MSRLRQWLRLRAGQIQVGMPQDMQSIAAANAASIGLQSYPAAMGPPDTVHGRQCPAVRFGPRYYFSRYPAQRATLISGHRAVESVQNALLEAFRKAGLDVEITSQACHGKRPIRV